MSSYLYGRMSSRRRQTDPDASLAYGQLMLDSTGRLDFRKLDALGLPTEKEPTVSKAVDVVTALVPAEVLAIHAAVVGLANDGGDHNQALQVTWWVLAFLPAVLYFMGQQKRVWIDYRALIPCLAFVAWTILSDSITFDAVWPEIDEVLALLIGLVAALILGGGTFKAATKADKEKPT